MENKIYTVVITEQESDLIEQLQYETHVQLSILHYLLRQGDISDDIIEKYNPDVCAIEKLFFFRNQTTVMPVAHARGVILTILELGSIRQ